MKIVRVTLPVGLRVYRQGGRTKCLEEGRCRMCERPDEVRPLTRHHLVKQAWFNRRSFLLVSRSGRATPIFKHLVRDVDANIVPLCAPCHTLVEIDFEARAMLRKVLAPEEVAFYVKMRGQVAFDLRYRPSLETHRVLVSAA